MKRRMISFLLVLLLSVGLLPMSAYADGSSTLRTTVPDFITGIDDPSQVVSLDQSYILLMPGEGNELKAETKPAELSVRILWSVTDENGEAFTPGEEIISVSDTGAVTALSEGTAYAVASVTVNGETYSARCRVDVVAPETAEEEEHPIASRVTAVSLPETKATVELYRTDYTRIPVLLEMERLLKTGEPENNGAAIESARFTDDAVASLFDLRVVDDRTLEIIPTKDAIAQAQEKASNIKSSYKSAIGVIVDGQSLTPKDAKGKDILFTLTVKKSVPNLKVGALKFNSVIPGDTQPIVITGGNVTALEEDTDAAAKAKKPAVPEWMDVTTGSPALKATAPVKGSGKLYLLADVEGWAVKKPITVSYSIAATYPKITFKPSSVTLKPGTLDTGVIAATITPDAFENYGVDIKRITEGSGKTMQAYANDDVISVKYEDNTFRIKPVLSDGKAHTYKVYFQLSKIDNKEYSFTVKTLAEKTAVTVAVKQSGAIDTAIKNSPITLTVTPKNFNKGSGESYYVRVEKYKAKTEPVDVTDLFNIEPTGNVLTLTEKEKEEEKGSLESGYTYNAYVWSDVGGAVTPEVKVKLNVKWSDPNKVPAGVTLKAAGSIDVIRPGTSITITPTVKNCFTYEPKPEDLVFVKTEGKSKTTFAWDEAPFNIQVKDGKFVLTAKENAINHKTEKYTVSLSAEMDGATVSSKPISLSIKQGSAKATLSPTAVTLLAKDRYSSGEFMLTVPDKTLSEIRYEDVTLGTDKTSQLFHLTPLGGGKYAISYEGNQLPAGIKAGSSKTVKLLVTFEGNTSGTANLTLSLKVNIR